MLEQVERELAVPSRKLGAQHAVFAAPTSEGKRTPTSNSHVGGGGELVLPHARDLCLFLCL